MKIFRIAIAGSLWAAFVLVPSQVASAANLCKYGTGKYATLGRAVAGKHKCIRLRSTGAAADSSPYVWELTPDLHFAARCPVSDIRLSIHDGTACTGSPPSALDDHDQVRVNEWGKDRFELSIFRNGERVFHPSQGPVMLTALTVNADGKRTIGYYAENVLVRGGPTGNQPVPVSYYVYLRTAQADGQYLRWYDIEVFDDSEECRKEIPGSKYAGTELVECLSDKALMEYPSGGGGEDPPG